MKEFKDDTFLARWLSGDLSDEELKEFESSADYSKYQKIIAGAGNFQSAEFDQTALLNKIKGRLDMDSPKGHSRNLWVYSAAASVVILLGFAVYSLFLSSSQIEVSAGVGERKTIALPDGSEVVINASSSLSYNEDTWDEARSVSLFGEAYFKVKNGSDFSVTSNSGTVTVLGTEFNVLDQVDYYEVSCFEGSVQVKADEEIEVLKPKRGVRKSRGRSMARVAIQSSAPSWVANQSTFNQVPFSVVLNKLKNQYGVTFKGVEIVKGKTYTGGFPHDDLDKSLRLVFGSVGIDYQLETDKVVILRE